jgi:type III pantothenate kinase
VVGNTEWLALQQHFELLTPPERIIISNVGGEALAQRLRVICSQWATPVEFVVARGEQCGVSNRYENPEQLGSDRWAALIAAWKRLKRACLVVNCGTATTVDALSNTGEFLGGLILPGVTLMQQSLKNNAAQLQASDGRLQDFPRNTADAIYSGVIRATLGAIAHQYGLLQTDNNSAGIVCVLSGGAAGEIEAHLGMPVERVDNLVLEGIKIIGDANA